MKVALRLCVLVAVFAVGLLAQKSAKPDFSGTWQLDVQRTRFGEVPQPKSLVLQIEHHEPEIQILMTTTNKDGDTRETLKLTTDGKQLAHAVHGQPCMASAQWHWWQGQRLVLDVKCQSVSRARRLTLGSKGNILTAVLTVKDSTGEKKAYEFFARR